MVAPGEPIPGDAALVIPFPVEINPGGDLDFLRAQGWISTCGAHRRRGGHVSACAALSDAGRSVADPDGIEGPAGEMPGLGLLDVTTVMTAQKSLTRVEAVHATSRESVNAYRNPYRPDRRPDRCVHSRSSATHQKAL